MNLRSRVIVGYRGDSETFKFRSRVAPSSMVAAVARRPVSRDTPERLGAHVVDGPPGAP